jgi:hypothetical protein
VLSWALIVGGVAFFVVSRISVSKETTPLREAVSEVPREYAASLELLLKDFQAGSISSDRAIQILILWNIRNEGIFLPLSETDTYLDKYLVEKKQHVEIDQMKKSIKQFRK